MQQTTLVHFVKDGEICLAFKKRGFGEGNWNGYGGKIEEGETILDAAVRETEEESTVVVRKEDLKKVAVFEFLFESGVHIEVNSFFVRKWVGSPKETEEMRPKWFKWTEIPYDNMWEDDQHWLPRVLLGQKLRGKVWFDESEVHIKKMKWKRVEGF